METAILQCRACLCPESGTKKHKFLSENGLNDIFRDLTQIQLTYTTKFNKICQKCVKQLKSFSDFRLKCLESHQYFDQIVSKQENDVNLQVKEEELIVKDEEDCDDKFFDVNSDKVKVEEDFHEEDHWIVSESESRNHEEDHDDDDDKALITIKECRKPKSGIKRGPYKKKGKYTEDTAEPTILFCKDCPDKIFTNKYYFRQHLKSHNEGSYECHFCGRKYHKKSFLHGHIDRNHIEKDFSKKGDFACHLCERKYLTDFRLKQHLGIHRLKEKACPICGKLTRHLTSHLLKHEEPAERFQCDKCEKNYKSEKHLLLHAIVHENKLFACQQCGKAFNTPEKVQAHMRNVHNPNRPTFECSVCHKHFYYRKYLTGHMRMHTGEKPFPCTFCDMSFAVRNNLTKHLHVHTNTKPYMCKYCSYGTRRKPQFLEHMRMNHLEEQQLAEANAVPPILVTTTT